MNTYRLTTIGTNEDHVLAEWQHIVGKAYVNTAEHHLRTASTATFKQRNKVTAIISPANTDEVQKCLKIANQHKHPVYVISTGKNWGYGSGVPVTDNCAVIKLSRLNRILDYDDVLGTVCIEPGVTFAQLNDHFKKYGSKHFLNCPGNSADTSIVGLTMERGIVPGPRPNMGENISNLKVILPDSTMIHTGHARFGNIRTGNTYRQGLGPYIDGLFMQSNYGVVVEMTLHIDPFPEHFRYIAFSLDKSMDFPKIITLIRELKNRKIIGKCCTMFNDLRLISFIEQYPWKEADNITPLPHHCRQQIRKMLEGGEWYCEIGIEAFNEADENNKLSELMTQLKPFSDDIYVEDKGHTNSFYNPGMITGLQSIYWRKKALPKTLNPDSDQCGIIWCVPVVPFLEKDVVLCIKIITTILNSFNFEPGITIRFINTRYLYILAGIIYDRETHGEDAKAMKCYETLLAELYKNNYMPYRLGIQSMGKNVIFRDENADLNNRLKNLFDPNHILSPGRYEFSA